MTSYIQGSAIDEGMKKGGTIVGTLFQITQC